METIQAFGLWPRENYWITRKQFSLRTLIGNKCHCIMFLDKYTLQKCQVWAWRYPMGIMVWGATRHLSCLHLACITVMFCQHCITEVLTVSSKLPWCHILTRQCATTSSMQSPTLPGQPSNSVCMFYRFFIPRMSGPWSHGNWQGRHQQLLPHMKFKYIPKLPGMAFPKHTSCISSHWYHAAAFTPSHAQHRHLLCITAKELYFNPQNTIYTPHKYSFDITSECHF